MKRTQTKKGMSLIEMIMAIAIVTIGMEAMTILFLRSWESNKFIIEMGNASLIASRGVNQVVKEIRRTRQADNGDYPVESGDDFDLKVYLDIDRDNITERVHYYLSGSTLYRGITNPTSGTPVTYPSGDETTDIISTSVVNTESDPIFYYYNADYPADTPLVTPVAISNVRLVKVHLMINIDPNHAPDFINIESFAELRNLNDN